MRKLNIIMASTIILLLVIFYGCKKEFKQDTVTSAQTMTGQLKVSSTFNWSSVKEVTLTISRNLTGIVKITSEDGKIIYHKGYNHGVSDYKVSVSVPSFIHKLAINSEVVDLNKNSYKNGGLKSALLAEYHFSPAITFNSGTTRCPSMIDLDGTRFLLIYATGDTGPLYAKVGIKTGMTITYSPPFQFPGTNWAYYSTASNMVKIDDNNVLVAIKTSNDQPGKVLVVTVTGNTVTFGPSANARFALNYPSLARVDATHFVLAYNDEWNYLLYVQVVEVSGGISLGAEEYIRDARYIKATSLSNNSALLTFVKPSNGDAAAVVAVVNTTINRITFGPIKFIDAGVSNAITAAQLDPVHFICAFQDASNGNKGAVAVLKISGTSISFYNKAYFDTNPIDEIYVQRLDSRNYLILSNPTVGSVHKAAYYAGSFNNSNLVPYFSAPTYLGDLYGMQFSIAPLGTNDFVITLRNGVSGSPGYQYLTIPLVPDSDGDGIGDPFDDYPIDPERAFDNFFPAASYGSLGFEDLWPGRGDYDFNDVVVNYQFQTVTNASNNVVEIFARFTLMANGAMLKNGFGFNLPDSDPELTGDKLLVTGFHLSSNYITLNANGNEVGQTKPTIIVWDNTSDLLPDFSNTVLGNPYLSPVEFTLKLTTPGYSFPASGFAISAFNPFIICGMERGREVHLADRPPTNLADPDLFGMWEDNSIPDQNRYYKSAENLPWAIDVPEPFAYPLEKADITTAHLKFADWAQSSGALYPDWYLDLSGYRNSALIYSH